MAADQPQAKAIRPMSQGQRTRPACAGKVPFLLIVFAGAGLLPAQQPSSNPVEPMGTVATREARVAGGLEVHGDQAQLLTNASITAYDHTAPISLTRGGQVLVCSTSEFHLLRSGAGGALIFGLNRGALEIRSGSLPRDVVLTPDLKLAPITPGPLDLSLRVTPEGDTCVDNAGPRSPVLLVTDPFSSSTYRILPSQHLLFVKGDLHRVVDHERSSCGCPAVAVPQVIAGKPGQPLTPTQAAAAHPFPEAQSAGLAPIAPPANAAPAGVASSQVTTSFSYADGQGTPPPVSGTSAAGGTTPASAQTASSGPIAPHPGGFGSALRRFFHRLFHPSAD